YHEDKASRGYDRLINVLGADHHGYVARLRSGLAAVGFPKDGFEVLLYQLVKLLRDGEEVKMGKRLGNLITVDEVVEEIDAIAGRVGAGSDALRYYYLSRRTETPISMDIEQAKKQSVDNPVFYLQYGHARLCAILRRADECFGLRVPRFRRVHESKLTHPDELAMLMLLGSFPRVVETAAKERAPHRVLFFLQELSQAFQSYFTRLKSVDRDAILPQRWQREQPGWEASWDWELTQARLAWINAIRVVYRAGLELLGIHAPEHMESRSKETAAGDVAAGDVSADDDTFLPEPEQTL
ncbi:MAG: DALR anticodon-binding domain-containing protein, partial [Polyangiaceae bacterium]|nr:DALR anticodon-binding domain-containing protein [Polyangiaceae bacterium]